jgi:uncharacterized protein (TIGR02284 family)
MKEAAVMDRSDMISTLNNLVETCRNGENGFRTAAEGVDDPSLKSLFQNYSRQRAEFVSELQAEVRRLGGDPQNTGSVAASLHRGWINIKSLVTGKDEGAIIAECERGEDSALRNYEEALRQPLDPQTMDLVRQQHLRVKEAHDRVRALELAHTSR